MDFVVRVILGAPVVVMVEESFGDCDCNCDCDCKGDGDGKFILRTGSLLEI